MSIDYHSIDSRIRKIIDRQCNIAIYPFGKWGMFAEAICRKRYGKKVTIIDNFLSRYNNNIYSLDEFIRKINDNNTVVLLCVENIKTNKMMCNQLSLNNIPYENTHCVREVMLSSKKDYFEKIKKLCAIKQVQGYNFKRIGKNNDGGYVMLDDFDDVNVAYSFGVGADISWEKAIAEHKIDVFSYDHTIPYPPATALGVHWKKIGVGGQNSIDENKFTLNTILKNNNHTSNSDMILKMDIEGAEYDVIENTNFEVLNLFKQITLEYHYLLEESMENRVISSFEKMNVSHVPVWVHANNGGRLGIADNGIKIPDTLEVTFANINRYNFTDAHYDAPIDIDEPNSANDYEIELKGWGSLDVRNKI